MVRERGGASRVRVQEGGPVQEHQNACECVFVADHGGDVDLGLLAEIDDEREKEEEQGRTCGGTGGMIEAWQVMTN